MLAEGTYEAEIVDCKLGYNKKDERCVDVLFQIVDGKGRINRQMLFNDKSIGFTRRDLMLLGWDGKQASQIAAQVSANKSRVVISVEHVNWTNPKTGKVNTFPAVKNIGQRQLDVRDFAADELAKLDADMNAYASDVQSADAGDAGMKRFDDIPF